MRIRTGETVYELLISADNNNLPLSAATFSTSFYIDGVSTGSIVPTISLITPSISTFSISWSASTTGFHQMYAKNNITNVIYVSDLYHVLTDSELNPSPTIYVGI